MPNVPFADQAYGAYQQARATNDLDEKLMKVGPGTPGGEYLRRFWQPVAFTNQLDKGLPLRLRILGEDLVLFRDGSRRLGLLPLHCSHRGSSLEFGIIRERGIQCCYHGWLYDVDGRILDTPGEPKSSPLRCRTHWHGAYPIQEYKGLVFAYFGPPDRKPPFPLFDMFEAKNFDHEPWGGLVRDCHWLQVTENVVDPVHTAFLHTIISGSQFTDSFGVIPTLRFEETPLGVAYVASRRVNDNLWVRCAEVMLPNIYQLPPVWETGEQPKSDQLPIQTVWEVPIDDTHTINLGFNHYDPGDPITREEFHDQVGFGQMADRPYEERQRVPGDWDAQVTIGPAGRHARERLGWADQGVLMLRRRLRQAIQDVEEGRDPIPDAYRGNAAIRTHSRDWVHDSPATGNEDQDRKVSEELTEQFVTEIIPPLPGTT